MVINMQEIQLCKLINNNTYQAFASLAAKTGLKTEAQLTGRIEERAYVLTNTYEIFHGIQIVLKKHGKNITIIVIVYGEYTTIQLNKEEEEILLR